jgi:UMF1 family MFS transporter
VFAPYFASFVAPDPASGHALWGFATAAAGLMIALLSPVLGAIADAAGRRKPWIAGFGALLVIGACAMRIGRPGDPTIIPPLLLAWLGGKLDDRLGPKRVIMGSMLILLLSITAILLVDKDSILFVKVAPPVAGGALFAGAAERAYLILGCLIGAAGGPLQAASRTLLIRLAPKDRIAQYFGLFALTGKVTSFIGPLLIGAITAVTASQKAGMAVLVVFFVAGLVLLARVRD